MSWNHHILTIRVKFAFSLSSYQLADYLPNGLSNCRIIGMD